jgi:hypothetical protein
MSEPILILGKSGSGKSYSLRDLEESNTLLVSVDHKRFPFSMKGWSKMSKENPQGGIWHPGKHDIYNQTKAAVKKAAEIGKKIIVIDDSQFLMATQFFNRAMEKGFDKFTEMGEAFHSLIEFCRELPDDVIVYLLHHTELDSDGSLKVKTVGKMLDQQTSIEGKFTVCLLAQKMDGEYKFRSSLPNDSIIKAPPGMFESETMDNNLVEIDKAIREYWIF